MIMAWRCVPLRCLAPGKRQAHFATRRWRHVARAKANGAAQGREKREPPVAERVPDKHETPYGDLEDDLKWIRDDSRSDEKVLQLLRAEDEFAKEEVAEMAPGLQETLFTELRGRIQEEDVFVAERQGNWWVYGRVREGDQYGLECRCPVSNDMASRPMRHDDMPPEGFFGEEVMLDENKRAEGTSFYESAGEGMSPDGSLFALAEDVTGDEVFTLRVYDLATGEEVIHPIEGTSGDALWSGDSRHLFFTTKDHLLRPYKVFRVRVSGPSEANDCEEMYHESDDAFFVGMWRNRADDFIVVQSQSQVTSEASLLPASGDSSERRLLFPRQHNVEYNPEISGRFAYIYRRADWCPDGELLSCPLDDPDGASVALPHRAGVQLEGLSLSRRYALVLERVDALPRLRVHELLEEGGLGEPVEVELPLEVCEVRIGDCGDFDSDVFRIAVTSTATPTTILDFHATNPNDKAVKRVTPVRGGFDSSKYKVERLNAPSRGGSETIPLTLTYRPDKTAWPTPCLLEVYGAYGANLDVSFSPNIISLLDRGVTLAQAHVRGGSERGRRWYEAGKLFSKKNTFYDTVDAGEYLVGQGWTDQSKLGIIGGSAGGMTVGAALNMRPELFRAAVLDVPFVDCLATMLDESLPLTIIEFDEWGSPAASKEMFDYIRSYSPINNLIPGALYPSVLVTSGLYDPRVQYFEPAKYVQRLRSVRGSSDRPVLHRVQLSAGHMSVSGRFEVLKETAFKYAFLLTELGVASSP